MKSCAVTASSLAGWLSAICFLAALLPAQKIQVGPSDVTVDSKRVAIIDVPGERPIQALALCGKGAAARLYLLSEKRLLVFENGHVRVLAELPAPASTLVALADGHLLAGAVLVEPDGRIVRDYGLTGVYAATADSRGRAYTVTYPDGQFYVLEDRAVPQGKLYERSLIGVDEHFRAVPQALAVDVSGAVWMSGELGFLYRYSEGKLEKTSLRLPAEKGREFLNVVQRFAGGGSAVLYGGTSDGYLFRLDTARFAIESLGRPTAQPGIRALGLLGDGSLLGVSGDQLFSWRAGVYAMLGRLEYVEPNKFRWMAYDLDSMVIAEDGTAYFGESQFRAHLFVLKPERGASGRQH
jgi:hypothetical protein